MYVCNVNFFFDVGWKRLNEFISYASKDLPLLKAWLFLFYIMFKVFKKCTTCGEEKFIQTFAKTNSTNSGYQSVCKKCANLKAVEYRAAKKTKKEAEKQELLDRYGKFNKQNQ